MGTPLYTTDIIPLTSRPTLTVMDDGDYFVILDTSTGKISKILRTDVQKALSISYDNATSGLTATQVQAALDELVVNLGSSDSAISALGGRLDILEADESTEGSVAYDIKQSSDALKGVGYTEGTLKAHEDRLDTLESDDTTEGSVLKSIKDNAEGATFTPTLESGITSVVLKDAVNEVGGKIGVIKDAIDEVAGEIAVNKAVIEALSMDKDVVGLKYNKTTKVYTRLGAAASWSASACQGSYDENVTSDFDQYPLYAGRKLIKANDDFTEVYEQGDDGYDDFDGDEYVRQPVGWFKDYEDDVERIVLLSAYPKSGFKVHPRFLDKNGNILPYADLGRFEGSVVGGKMYSKADLPPTNNISIGSANAAARAKSTSEIFTLRTVYDWDFDALMAAVEFGTFNLQSAIGRGMVDFSISNSNTTTLASSTPNTFITTPAIMAQFAVGDYVQLGSSSGSGSVADGRRILSIEDYDGTNVIVTFDGDTVDSVDAGVVITYDAQPVSSDLKNALGMKSGYVGTNGKSHVAYRGAWDLWGESGEMLDMIIKYDNTIYLGKDPQTAHSYYSNPGASGSTYESTGFVTLKTAGYVSAMKRITAEGSKFSTSMTYALGGDSSNGYADYYYDSDGAGEARMVLAGGDSRYGSNAGAFDLYLLGAVGGSGWYIVGRLSHHKA
jgi:hypothetical protein